MKRVGSTEDLYNTIHSYMVLTNNGGPRTAIPKADIETIAKQNFDESIGKDVN